MGWGDCGNDSQGRPIGEHIPRGTKKAERHMAAVAALGCIACRNTGREGDTHTPAEMTGIHHIREGQGGGQRASDFEVLPLCGSHHQTGGAGVAFHAGKETWQAKFGTEEALLIQVYLELAEARKMHVGRPACDCEYCMGKWPELLGLTMADVEAAIEEREQGEMRQG